MSNVQRQVRAAGWRLNLNVLVASVAWGVLIGSGLFSVYVLAQRLLAPGMPDLGPVLFAAAIVVVGLVGWRARRVERLGAAIALDQAAGLRERISSALALRGVDDDFARATVSDAERSATGMRVAKLLPLRAPAHWPWSAGTLMLALLLYGLMPQLDLLAGLREEKRPLDPQAVAQGEAVAGVVNQQIESVRRMVEENAGLTDLAEQLAPLEMPDRATLTPEDVRREAVKHLDDLREKIEQAAGRDEMKALEDLKRQLARLQPETGRTPTAELSQSLNQGDMRSAREALEKLQQEIADLAGKNDAESQEKLNEMAEQLAQLAEQLERLADDTALRKELENRAGLTEEQAREMMEKLSQLDPQEVQQALAEKLQESGLSQEQVQQLAQRMQQRMQAQQQCQQMGQGMQQAADAMQQCAGGQMTAEEAAQALQAAMAQLSELESNDQAQANMQAAMAELQMMREGMCRGEGGEPNFDDVGSQGPQEGLGYGSRIGRDAKAHDYDPQKARSQLSGGEIIGQTLVDGPQARGEATAQVRDAVMSAVRDAQDAVERQAVPRRQRGDLERVRSQHHHAQRRASPDGDRRAAPQARLRTCLRRGARAGDHARQRVDLAAAAEEGRPRRAG